MRILFLLTGLLGAFCSVAQTGFIKGTITNIYTEPLSGASISLPALKRGTLTNQSGEYALTNVPNGRWQILISHAGYENKLADLVITDTTEVYNTTLLSAASSLDEVVVSGTMKEVSKLESPVPVEVYSSRFFKANPSPSIFDALQNINGVRPQLNCNICNTGDIHINGLEGPYTMVMIDGMPIVSGLSTVYGLSGIPQSLIDRVEVVKGPASTLYGSEAVGGLVNIITKNPLNAPIVAVDVFGTSWGEINTDLAAKFNTQNATSLVGINYYNYQQPIDNNGDNFTDVTLQNRVSAFNKWSFRRKENRIFTLAGRYIYEDRWGGEMNWSTKKRGGDEVYGESIYTKRWEFFGTYQLPVKEKIMFQFSANGHDQNSAYGNMFYMADQYIGFGQMTWFKTLGQHDILSGITYRYTYYDDNTPATAVARHTSLPGAFVQDEISLNDQNKILVGLRYDYNSIHGSIFTPRLNYKWNSRDRSNILRLSIGNGYRVANVFTEDHAALTGARDVIFKNNLAPEKSWNANVNFTKKIYVGSTMIGLDATAFYTYFTNKIIPDYDTNPNLIIYDNLDGHAVSRGVSLNVDMVLPMGLKLLAGATTMNVFNTHEGDKVRQLFAERFTGVWNIGYTISKLRLSIDYTGNLYGPMRLPLLSDTDPRRAYSPWWSIQNIQLTKKIAQNFEIYGGVKNLLNWTPNRGNPFIIARAHDPFDKQVQFNAEWQAMATPDNPYGLTFDPSYIYGPNQGIRGFLGIRYTFLK